MEAIVLRNETFLVPCIFLQYRFSTHFINHYCLDTASGSGDLEFDSRSRWRKDAWQRAFVPPVPGIRGPQSHMGEQPNGRRGSTVLLTGGGCVFGLISDNRVPFLQYKGRQSLETTTTTQASLLTFSRLLLRASHCEHWGRGKSKSGTNLGGAFSSSPKKTEEDQKRKEGMVSNSPFSSWPPHIMHRSAAK